jgi:hypothetical protein
MHIKPKKYHFFWQLLLFFLSCFYCFTLVAIKIANAQETVEAANSVSESTIAQAEPSQPTRRRIKNPFFEQERKLRFGYGDFLESALDGADNFFAADSITNLSNVNLNAQPIPGAQNIPGVLTVGSRDQDDPNFLTTTYVAPGVNLTFSNPSYGSDPRIGTLTVNGAIRVGDQSLIFNNLRANYSGSFSFNNNRVSGAVQVVDPSNPGNSIFIQLPPTIIPDVDNDNTPISAGAGFSTGLPTDR